MFASRGDTKQCTATDCAGTMQFGRRRDSVVRPAAERRPMDTMQKAMDDKGWVCDTDPKHFRIEE